MCPIYPIHWIDVTIGPRLGAWTTRRRQSSGLRARRYSRFALGCMGMGAGSWYGRSDEAEGIATIHAALDAGVNLIDTGDFYGMGKNELLVGKALAGRRRDQALLSVKFGGLRGPDGAFLGYDARPAATKSALAHSLSRLGVDYIDIYRPSRLDPGGADRGDHRRDRRHGEGGLRAPHRSLGGRRRDDPAGREGASHLRPADRVLARQPHPRAGDLPRARRAWHRGHDVRRPVARPPHRQPARRRRAIFAPTSPASRAKTPRRTGASPPRWRAWPRRAGSHRRSSPSPGCAPRASPRRSRSSPPWAPAPAPSSPRPSPASTSRSAPTRSPGWKRPSQQQRLPAHATRRPSWRCSTASGEPHGPPRGYPCGR